MTRPTKRELCAVSKIPLLSAEEVATLYQVLQTIGFDIGTIALFWEKSEDEIKRLFRLDSHNKEKIQSCSLTGVDLAWWCELISLRPGVVQRRLNFDESNLRLKKQGRSSMRVPMVWIGPPIFATKGAVPEGRAFCELSDLVTMPVRSAFTSVVMSQIIAGKYALRLSALQGVVEASISADLQHPKLAILQNAFAAFPPMVRTPDEVLEALTSIEVLKSQTVLEPANQKEESMRMDMSDQFRSEFARSGLELILQKLSDKCKPIAGLLHEWSIALDRPYIHLGELEVLVSSAAFKVAKNTFPELATPLIEMHDRFTQLRSQAESLRKSRQTVRIAEPVQTSLVKGPQVTTVTTGLPSKPVISAPKKSITKIVSMEPEYVEKTTTPVRPTVIETDKFGLRWDKDSQRVTIGAMWLSQTLPSDTRLAADSKTAQRRVYDVLSSVREKSGIGWEEFLRTLSVDRLWVSGLSNSSSVLTAKMFERIIVGFRDHYDLNLTPEQLFGLSPLPEIERVKLNVLAPVEESEELLFIIGDKRGGVMWSMMLRQYTSVRRWFEKNYGLTAMHLAQIEAGEIGVPIKVHLVLMKQVTERMAGVDGIIVPIVYKRLMSLPQSEPVKDGVYVFDHLLIPCKSWLTHREGR